MVSLSMEVTSGVIEAVLPVKLVNTTELKLRSSYQWQPLQTFVTISEHFVVKARGVRFQGAIDDCNIILQQLKYYSIDYGAVLKIVVNDMGIYGNGCFLDCEENVSKPLQAEANVNLIKRRPLSSGVADALGFIIILEFLVMLSLGAVMLFYTCKCAISLINERRNPDINEDADHPIQTSDRQYMRKNKVAEKPTSSARSCPSPVLFSGVASSFCQRQRPRCQAADEATTRNGSHNQPASSTAFRSLQIEKSHSEVSS